MTEAEFEDALKMAQAARIAYERGLIPEDKWRRSWRSRSSMSKQQG